MDPAAGGFQVFGDRGEFLGNALSRSYTHYNYPKDHNGEKWYRPGDNWYRDMFAPGYEGENMPGGYYGYDRQTTSNLLSSDTSESSADIPAEIVDVSSYSDLIDGGRVHAIFNGRHRRDGTSRNAVNIWIEFLDEDNQVMSRSAKIGSERAPAPSTVYVPTGTRRIGFYTENFVRAGEFRYLTLQLNLPASNSNANESAISWLAKRVAQDTRFAKAAVRFWYKGLFNRSPLDRPMDTSSPDYAKNLRAFQQQDAIFNTIATRFRNQGYRVKDLLLDLILSDWFTAKASSQPLTDTEKQSLSDLGTGRLLKSYELEAKFHALLGHDLMNTGNERFYDGFDGGIEILTRNESITSLLLSIPDQGINAVLCNNRLVDREFRKPVEERILLPYVEREDVDEALIKTNLQYLHRYLLNEQLALDSEELDRTYQLFSEIQALNLEESERLGFICEGRYYSYRDGEITGERGSYINDPAGTVRAWNGVLLYLLGDFLMLNE